jgi:DNA-binding response OmpR family regulator
MITVLVVEDNPNIRKLYHSYLTRAGYQVLEAMDGKVALNILEQNKIDLMIVDVMMPRMDGYELTESLRSSGFDFPILMITAKDRFEDKRIGFTLGSDDYMVKPIDFDEMVLRVEALLRRAKIVHEHVLQVGELRLYEDYLSIIKNNQSLTLPKKEFQLLYKLLSYPGKIFTRQQLMEEFWGMDVETDERTIDVHINRLREKVEVFEAFEILTVRGLGYKAEVKQ